MADDIPDDSNEGGSKNTGHRSVSDKFPNFWTNNANLFYFWFIFYCFFATLS